MAQGNYGAASSRVAVIEREGWDGLRYWWLERSVRPRKDAALRTMNEGHRAQVVRIVTKMDLFDWAHAKFKCNVEISISVMTWTAVYRYRAVD